MNNEPMPTILCFELPTELPIVGVEIIPKIVIAMPSLPAVVSDVPSSSPVDGVFMSYKWSRVTATTNATPCHMHPSEPGTIQCQFCSSRKTLIPQSYHCSTKCFQDAWVIHKETHERFNQSGDKQDSFNNYNPYAGAYSPPRQVIQVGSSRAYTPTAADVGFTLKLEMSVVSAETRKVLVLGGSTSTPCRVVRVPVPIYRGLISTNEAVVKGKPGSFSVLTYNILADDSAMTSLYNYCTPWARLWTYRRLNLLNEILGYGADIICLQDVQNDHFDDFLAPELHRHGYDVYYKRRTKESISRKESTIDGCATFYKREKFSFFKQYEVEFNKSAHAFVETVPSDDRPLASKRLIKDNIALIVILELKSGNQPAVPSEKNQLICVANTRLDVQKDMKDVIVWHVQTLLRAMGKIAEASNDMPMVMCGDFNMVPGSAAHSLVVMGSVDQSHQDLLTDHFGFLQPLAGLAHQLPLVSAYTAFSRLPSVARLGTRMKNLQADSKEPSHTIYTKDSKYCHDYIFFTGHTLRVEGVLELVDGTKLSEEKAIPSSKWPSSHLALLARFSCLP